MIFACPGSKTLNILYIYIFLFMECRGFILDIRLSRILKRDFVNIILFPRVPTFLTYWIRKCGLWIETWTIYHRRWNLWIFPILEEYSFEWRAMIPDVIYAYILIIIEEAQFSNLPPIIYDIVLASTQADTLGRIHVGYYIVWWVIEEKIILSKYHITNYSSRYCDFFRIY